MFIYRRLPSFAPHSPVHSVQGLLPQAKLSCLTPVHATSEGYIPSESQFLLYLVVSPFGLWPGVTWLCHVSTLLWLGLGVTLMWTPTAATNSLSHLGSTFYFMF